MSRLPSSSFLLLRFSALTAFAGSLTVLPAAARSQPPSTNAAASQVGPTPTNHELAEMQTALSAVMQKQPVDFTAYSALTEKHRVRIAELIARDELRTASDFVVASTLYADPGGFYENRRVEHELALAALVLGHPDALRRVALSWDGLNWSMGLGQRLGSYTRGGVPNNMDPVPAPAMIRKLFKDPAAARARAATAADNAALQQMRDEDQADREEPLTREKIARMNANDSLHLERTLRLIADGVPVTGRDMHNAATVLQHGLTPANHRLAHELAIAAIALGDTSAVWLVSRSYDRMLLGMGHRQRLNTQYGGADGKLRPNDATAVNDRIRTLLGSKPM